MEVTSNNEDFYSEKCNPRYDIGRYEIEQLEKLM